MRLRQATPEDASAAAEVWLRSRHSATTDAPAPVHSDEEVRRWFADVVLHERELWVAEVGEGALVAVMVLDGDWLDQLYVGPDWTGRGIGSQLVTLAKRLRPGGLQLWTFESNTGAQRFYEQHGFVAVERTDGSGNEERSPDVRYSWSPPT